jgi:hypothetical protein
VPLHICEWAWSSWFILALLVVPHCHRFAPHWHWAAEWLSAWPLALAVHGAASVWGRLHLTKFFFFFKKRFTVGNGDVFPQGGMCNGIWQFLQCLFNVST